MNLYLKRNRADLYGVFGVLSDEIGNQVCVTLEHAFPQPDGSFAALIPVGIYTCIRRHSPRFQCDVFMLKNVPDHDFVEIHWGNYNKDSDGCILVGTEVNSLGIGDSREAFAKLMAIQNGAKSFLLVVA